MSDAPPPPLPLFATLDASAEPEPPAGPAEARMAFLLRLRARGIADVDLLRALESAPREAFAPFRYRDLALRDVAIPLPCGQTMPEPWLVARMIEALDVAPGRQVLEIGSGTGYATAILAQLAGAVLSLERFRSLAIEAQGRLASLGFANVEVVWADGLTLPARTGPFDRILVHGAPPSPGVFASLLREDGVMVAGLRQERSSCVMRYMRGEDGSFSGEAICDGRLAPLIPGVSRAL
jgi:protein-L-isoaspartate(D-aspartate) O-methyltransferase